MSKYVITSGSVPQVVLAWDPDDKGSTVTLSMGNAIANSYIHVGVRGNIGISSGKAYLEYTPLANVNSYVLGVSALNSNFDYSSTGVAAYCGYDGTKYLDSYSTTYGATFTGSDVIGMALDMDSNTITFYKNGVSQGPILYNFKAFGTVYPFYSNATTSSGNSPSVYINGGRIPFKYPIPTGYSPWGLYSLMQNISEMAIGDYISCEYTATSGAFGTFANLGKATKAKIPVASSDTPNGTFHFIMAGYDSKGRRKLIADRNIQNNISWDALNTAGIASGSGLPVVIDGGDNLYTMRLLSGGVSATDKDNEWDKMVVESNLNGTITPGDNNVWNWLNRYSWASSTPFANSGWRAIRGYGASSTYYPSGDPSSIVSANQGLRPVLIVEDGSKVTINKVTPLHLYGIQHVGLQIGASASYINVGKDFKLRVNGVDIDSYGSSTTRNISMDKFIVGNNTVSAVAADGGSASITVILEAPYRLSVGRTFNSFEGGYATDNINLNTNIAVVSSKYLGTVEKLNENLFSMIVKKIVII